LQTICKHFDFIFLAENLRLSILGFCGLYF